MNKQIDLSEVKKGDWVYHILYGWVEVVCLQIKIAKELYYIGLEIKEQHAIHTRHYFTNGKLKESNANPTLYTYDPINGTKPRQPEIDWFKVPADTDVEVSAYKDFVNSYVRRFALYMPNANGGQFTVFNGGENQKKNNWCDLLETL